MAAISLGTIRGVHRYPGFTLAEVSIPATEEALPPHRHALAQLYLVLDGVYAEKACGRDFMLGPGSALFRPAGVMHANRFLGEEVHGMLVEMEPAAARMLLPGISEDAPVYFPAHAFNQFCDAFGLEVRRSGPETVTALRGLTLCLAAEVSRGGRILRSRQAPPAWLLEAAGMIRNHCAEDLRLSRLAAAVGVTPVRLTAAFRIYFHASVGGYLTQMRVARARSLLTTSHISISDIALGCGFYDQAHFTRVFKRRHGITPAKFRALCEPA